MISLKVEYRVKREKVHEIKQAIEEFVHAIKNNEPRTKYFAFQHLSDKQSFTHFMTFRSEKGQEEHESASYTDNFTKILYPACEGEPQFTEISQVE
jgi:quinol monooxygenase YgiN